MSSCNRVDNAGKPRTRAHSSTTSTAAGPSADHPPPAANPHFSAAFLCAVNRGVQ